MQLFNHISEVAPVFSLVNCLHITIFVDSLHSFTLEIEICD